MPNHLTTVAVVTGSPADLDRFESRHIVKTDDGGERFALESIIHKPKCVEDTESGTEADAGFYALTGMVDWRFLGLPPHNPIASYTARGFNAHRLTTHEQFRAWLEVNHPHVIEKGRKSLECLRETGFRDWYEWSIANWGTKWGAYEFKRRSRDPSELVFEFQTANGFPLPCFDKLAELYPELAFATTTIDEGGPEYIGRFGACDSSYERVEHDADRYRFVYGRDPYSDEDDDTNAEVPS